MSWNRGKTFPHLRSELRERVCALYLEGKSYKQIAKIIGRNHGLVGKWVRAAGMVDISRKIAAWNPNKYIEAEYHKENKALRKLDESRHWINHRVSLCSVLNQERLAQVARARAKRIYDTRKHEPEWRANRLKRHAEYMRANPHLRDRYMAKIKAEKPHLITQWRRAARHKPKNKIINNLRRRLRDLIHGKVGMRSNELVGCSHVFLVNWLEAQFKRGMSWDNYGTEWHVDHILPCASFELSDRAQAKRCFHYSNLRPLWADDNLAKGDTIPTHQPELCMPI